MLKIAINNLFYDKRKLVLSCCGTMLAIVLIIVCQSILNGTLSEAELYAKNVGADIFVTQEGVNKMLASISFFSETKIDEIRNIAGVEKCSPILANKYSFTKDGKVISAFLIGYDPQIKIGGPWKIAQGSNIVSGKEIIIDENISKANAIDLLSTVKLNDNKFKVVGFSNETNAMANQYMFVTIDEAREIFLADGMISYALITIDEDEADVETIISKINATIEGVDAYSKNDFIINNRKVQEEMISGPMNSMIIINFLIGSLIIAFSMYTISQSKIKDYAVLKAIGLDDTKIRFIVLFQALVNAIIGFTLGCAASQIATVFINSLGEGLTAAININIIYTSFLLSVIMSIIATFIPVRKLIKLDPSSVFQS